MSEKHPDISQIRKDYIQGTLDESHVAKDPILQFQKWLNEALNASLPEPHAMCLSTANRAGQPSARFVLLKSAEARGFVFYTNYDSHKATELAENPQAALTFFWQELERQIRIEGRVTKVSAEESEVYFRSRPRESQIGAWASPQSQIISHREGLEREVAALTIKFGQDVVPRPENWGGYLLDPQILEFWQGRASRLHDRIRYRKTSAGWIIERLAP